jgi:hypothetical protein
MINNNSGNLNLGEVPLNGFIRGAGGLNSGGF